MTVTATARAASRRRPPPVTVVWAIALAWAVAVAAELTGRAHGLHHDRLAQGTSAWVALGLFLLAWQLMIAAMMLPSSLPLVRLFSRASANQPRPLRAKAAFPGGYTFSRLKDRCLRVCRHPAGYLARHYRRGTGAALRLGAGHGVWCVGCCWALMLVAFAAGVANLWWMAALTALMVFEKTGRQGRRGVRPIGVGLIAMGLLVLASVP